MDKTKVRQHKQHMEIRELLVRVRAASGTRHIELFAKCD